MKLRILFVLMAGVFTGCVSVSTYKHDMASINRSIDTQNRNNLSIFEYMETHSTLIKKLERRLDKNDLWDYRSVVFENKAAITELQNFREAHKKRWPKLEEETKTKAVKK